LSDFRGVAACGGFSYGDVLGAGRGWANSVALHSAVEAQFNAFFRRSDTFALGVCNGCQFLGGLRNVIPGADVWPSFQLNESRRFEARLSMVEVVDTSNCLVFFRGMAGSRLPVSVAHAEGRASYDTIPTMQSTIALRYLGADGSPTQHYPENPNGSTNATAGVHSKDGRILALMPHPERVISTDSLSWAPEDIRGEWTHHSPWFKMFQNVYDWCN